MNLLINLSIIVVSISSIIFSWLTVSHKSLIYSALFLSLLGLANAALFFIMGFLLVAFMQIIIYVGAAVLFIIMSVSMMKEPPKNTFNIKYATMGVIALFILAITTIFLLGSRLEIETHFIDYTYMINFLLDYGYSGVIILFIVLSLALIASIVIVKRNDD